MLSREELKEIAALRPDDEHYVSLYLNVNPVTNPGGEHAIRYKNMLKESLDGLDKAVSKRVKEGIAAMDSYVLGNKRQFKKGLAILSSGSGGFFRAYNLSVPVKSELIIDKTPYLKPLFDILDNYERYAVLLIEKDTARIFVMHLGDMTEYGEIQAPNVPGKHKKGGWFALSQDRYERHVDYHAALHMKDVLEHLDVFLKAETIGRIIVGGPDEAVSMMKGVLPKPVSGKIVGSFKAGMYENTAEILAKVEPVVSAYEREQEKETIAELITRAEKDKKAVLGLAGVAQAVQEGKIMKLVFVRGFKSSGYSCKSCGALSAEAVKPCPYCKGEMEGVNYLVDLIAQKSVEQGAAVKVVSEGNGLSQKGNIGAILRF